jgi:hypothetical protein
MAATLDNPSTVCSHCEALKWKTETKGFCCQGGKVVLAPICQDYPIGLLQLLSDKAFLRNIRVYNSAFAFTSMGAKELGANSAGVPSFRVHGQVMHRMGTLAPAPGGSPQYAQLYFFDSDFEKQVDARLDIFRDLNRNKVEIIQAILTEVNPYVQLLRAARERNDYTTVKIKLIANQELDLRRYNLPTVSQVGVLFDDSEETEHGRDIVIENKSGGLQRISELHPSYDALQYPLLFPRGDAGFKLGILHSTDARNVTIRQFYAFHLQLRNLNGSVLHMGGRLFQQYLVDMFCKMEQNNFRFIRNNQSLIRAELYQGLSDAFYSGDHDLNQLGRRIVLPSSVTGSARNMQQLYQDSMAIVRKYGKPDLFITMTCNPNWPEIKRLLLPGQQAFDRPDIVARVFNQKLKQLMSELIDKKVLGEVVVKIHVIEFQKRGLPHAHILIILHDHDKPYDSKIIDRMVWAEIPDPTRFPSLYAKVTKHMLHGPCSSRCLQSNGICSKSFPKPLNDQTLIEENGYPTYKRTGTHTYVKMIGDNVVEFDSSWVVPYNPYLLGKLDCHLNVEICSSVTSIKYIHKYCFKGNDRSSAEVETLLGIDEIQVGIFFHSGYWY